MIIWSSAARNNCVKHLTKLNAEHVFANFKLNMSKMTRSKMT